jgi:AcrR family transcriptional regulator
MSKPSDNKETETPARILDAADRLLSDKGVRAVSLDDIAAAAGLTKRTLYYHFKTKDDLVAAWLARRSAEGAAPKRASPADDIAAAFDGLARFAAQPNFRGCPFVATGIELAEPKHPASVVGTRHKTARRTWFAERLKALGAADPDARAAELLVIWDGALAAAVLIRDGSPAKAAKRLAMRLLADAKA